MIKTAVFLLSTLWTVVYSYDVKVVSTVNSDERGPAPCIRQCLGSTGSNTQWDGYSDFAYVYFDTPDCGFKSGTSPHISTTLVQESTYTVDTGVYKVLSYGNTRYRVSVSFPYLDRANDVLKTAKRYKWRVDWVATGYTC